jgi:hypothetical protein
MRATKTKRPSARLARRRRKPGSVAGRKLAIDDAGIRKRLLDAALLGSYREDAAAYAGIGKDTLFQYLQRAEEARVLVAGGGSVEETELAIVEFVDAFKEAEAKAKARTLGTIVEAASGVRDPKNKSKWLRRPQWQAGAWFLERKYPEQFGRRIAVGNADGRPFALSSLAGIPADVLKREILEILSTISDEEDAAIAPLPS